MVEKIESKLTSDMIKIKNIKNMLEIAEFILYFNQLNQSGQGLKILTPSQMLRILPINLAQLKAWHNSEKLINEIRKLSYSLYRSKKLIKTIYSNLMNTI